MQLTTTGTHQKLYDRHLAVRIGKFVKAIATKKCWKLIRNYFKVDWIRGPSLALLLLLLSFPHSGYLFTAHHAMKLTVIVTATNYEKEALFEMHAQLQTPGLLSALTGSSPFLMSEKHRLLHVILTNTL
jgi:hypothetical protein